MVKGHQLTICWYVDDLKISQKDPEVVTNVINMLEQKFGSMNTTRGQSHTYLGMDFKIGNGKVELMMVSYLKECIVSFGGAINTSAKPRQQKY